MKKILAFAPLGFIMLGLAGCATGADGNYTIFGQDTGVNAASAQANAAATFSTVCAAGTVLASNPPAMSAVQKASLAQLMNDCTTPPTNLVAVAADALAAYNALSPLIKK